MLQTSNIHWGLLGSAISLHNVALWEIIHNIAKLVVELQWLISCNFTVTSTVIESQL